MSTKLTIEFGEIMHNNDRYAVQGHSRSLTLVPIESPYDFLFAINIKLLTILHRFQVMADYNVKFSLATVGCFSLTPSLQVSP